jgi:hypothetical protein
MKELVINKTFTDRKMVISGVGHNETAFWIGWCDGGGGV